MAKIKIEECKIVEKNLCEIYLTDIIYIVMMEEMKKSNIDRKVS